MGFLVKRTVMCNDCGKLFEIDIHAKVYSNETDLRDLISNAKIHFRKCPYCGKENNYPHPFMYIDEDRDFVIRVNNLDEHIAYYGDELKNNKSTDKTLLLGVTSLADLQSKIIMLENGLDYRIGTLYQIVVERRALKKLQAKFPKAGINFSRFIQMDDGFGIEVYFKNEEGKTFAKPIFPF